jgi:hypothetical protein
LSDYSNRLMVESNANLVRWMHITPWKQDVESCDRVGTVGSDAAGDSEKDIDGRRGNSEKDVMRDAIIITATIRVSSLRIRQRKHLRTAHGGE